MQCLEKIAVSGIRFNCEGEDVTISHVPDLEALHNAPIAPEGRTLRPWISQ